MNVMQDAVLRPARRTAPTRTSTGAAADPHRRARGGAVPLAAAADAPGDLGVSTGRRWARRCGRCSDAERERRLGSSRDARRDDSDRPLREYSTHGAPFTVLVSGWRPGHGGARCARCARTASARSARRHRHVRALGRAAPLRRVPPRAGGLRPALRRRDARASSSARAWTSCCPQSSFDLEGLAAHRERFPCPFSSRRPDAIHRSNDKAETYALLHRLGVPAPAFRRVERRGERRRGGARARLSRPAGVLQAGLLVGLARLPHPRPHGRPRAPAAARAAGLRGDAPRGGGRAAARRGRPRPARDGARDRRRADDRRDRRRPPRRARPPEDARGDARRARDVLRHARRRRS